MKIVVLRPFHLAGDVVNKDAEIEVSEALGKELIAANKAAPLEPPAPIEPLSVESSPGLVQGAK